jgi:hypothetical protein
MLQKISLYNTSTCRGVVKSVPGMGNNLEVKVLYEP